MSSSNSAYGAIPPLSNPPAFVGHLSDPDRLAMVREISTYEEVPLTVKLPPGLAAAMALLLDHHDDAIVMKSQIATLLDESEGRLYRQRQHERKLNARLTVATREISALQGKLFHLEQCFSVIMPLLSDISKNLIGEDMFLEPEDVFLSAHTSSSASSSASSSTSSAVDTVPPGLGASATRSKRRKMN